MRETSWFTKEGIMFRTAWGRTMKTITLPRVSPVESPASVCPRGMASMPAWTIWDM